MISVDLICTPERLDIEYKPCSQARNKGYELRVVLESSSGTQKSDHVFASPHIDTGITQRHYNRLVHPVCDSDLNILYILPHLHPKASAENLLRLGTGFVERRALANHVNRLPFSFRVDAGG